MMFSNIIEFSAHEDYFDLNEDFPIPAKNNIPDWYKKLEHTIDYKTIKGCIPFLDTLTAGYILKVPQDVRIEHNKENKKNGETFQDAFQNFALMDVDAFLGSKRINLNSHLEMHPPQQLTGSPLLEKNKNLGIHKILNPWKIKTPKGYSCLFLSPLNNSDDRFSIISGIVDTDVFPNEINFPIVINGDKYPVLDTIIKKGTPYVQVIPFKRETWKMVFKPRKQKEVQNSRLFYGIKLLNNYKERYWNKKSWK